MIQYNNILQDPFLGQLGIAVGLFGGRRLGLVSEKEIDWKELYREMMADGKYRCKGGTELGEQGKEIARKLQQWAKKLEREQWSDEVRVELDAELRRMYEQLPHSMYRDIIIYAGYTNYCIGISQHIRREQLCQELMKILRQQI